MNNYSSIPGSWENDTMSASPDVPAPIPPQKLFMPAVTPGRQDYEVQKRRQAALFYVIMCASILLVFLLLFISAMGGLSHLLSQKSSTSPAPGGGKNTGVAVTSPTQAAATATSGPSQIIFTPSTGNAPTPTPGITPTPIAAITPTVDVTPPPTPGVTPTAGGTGTVTPVLDCVIRFPIRAGYTAFFGYTNNGTATVTIPVGPNNHFVGAPINERQPTRFAPGSQTIAVTVRSTGRRVSWVLDGSSATATANSTPCF